MCAIVAIAVVGCKSTSSHGKPVAWNVHITKKTTASIEVDLVGVATANEENFLNGVSREDYWKPDSQIRNDQRKLSNLLTKFLRENQPWVVGRDDPQWRAWLGRGVFELFVVARLPEATGNWRVPVSLDKKHWKAKDKTIEIVVVDSGVQILTPTRD